MEQSHIGTKARRSTTASGFAGGWRHNTVAELVEDEADGDVGG
jgi:hypothetical protein